MPTTLPEPPHETRPQAALEPARESRQVKGLLPFSQRRIRQQKAAVLAVTLGPLVALAAGAVLLWGHGLSWSDVVVFTLLYGLSGLGITVGFHRMLTHVAFDARPWVRTTWAFLGSLAVEGPPITWVSDHRRHHAYSDRHGDPHSPHLHDDDGLRGQLAGLWHAHVGWMLNRTEDSDPRRWAPDLLREPGVVAVNRAWVWITLLSIFVLPTALGFALTTTAMGAFTAFIWGGPVRVLVLHHVTWSINSICHVFGRRDFASDDMSANNWALSLVSFGESWHNNHHAFPSSAALGLRWWQVDIGGIVIRSMQRLRLVSNVKVPSAGALDRKRVPRG